MSSVITYHGNSQNDIISKEYNLKTSDIILIQIFEELEIHDFADETYSAKI